jgi:putative transposase
MPHSYCNLLYHIVFSTKDRRPWLTAERRPKLCDYMGGVIRNRGGILLAANGIEDHIHVLAKLRPDKALSDVLRDLKAGSSGWVSQFFPDLREFKWQNGYAAFTVSASQVADVKKYIAHQEEHHRKFDFRAELMALLRANEIDFDERYLLP